MVWEALSGGLPFFFCGESMSGSSRHCPAYGGAMAEADKGKESSKAGDLKIPVFNPKRPDPERGLVGVKSWVWELVVNLIFENLPTGMAALANRIKEGDVTMIKFVMELLDRFADRNEDPHSVLVSFSELLTTSLKGLPAETGDEAGADAPAST